VIVEVIAAALLAAAAIWLVLGPLMWPEAERIRAWEPPDPEETARGVALSALREIEFDKETGKLSDADYAELKAEYTVAAVAAIRQEAARPSGVAAGTGGASSVSDSDVEAMIAARARAIAGGSAPACRSCGPRPESDAVFCSACGRRLDTVASCGHCSAPVVPGSNFCESCGARVAA
jgi:hypothetical protein